MRLLNARTYELQTFLGKDKPNYAILSHTWEDGEVLFEDIRNTSKIDWTAKKGYFKIKKTCDQALEDGCDFVWIDTCNINKDSSSELSEAINSMFRWYKDATICYAYISDIKIGDEWSFSKCRWLTRGWTLQEMIAPDRVHFYDADWSFLGSRISLANELSGISGIQKSVLLRRNYTRRLVSLSTEENMDRRARMNNCSCCKDQEEVEARSMLETFSVAQKMKWASERTTTREEDVAYCLMGLFDVNMPLLYGEGTRAFFRLQKAILEMRSDHSILAFRSNLPNSNGEDCPRFLAPNPTAFCDDIQSIYTPAHVKGASLHGTTLSIDMLLCPVQGGDVFPKRYLAILDCSMADDPHARPAILLLAIDHEDRKTFRCTSYTNNLYLLHSSHPGEARAMVVDTSSERDLSVLLYKPRDIKRVHISIVGEDLAMRFIRHYSATRYVQVNISSVFRDLGYQYASSLPLTEEHMVFSTSQPGLIDILHERAGNLSVYWNQDAYGLLSCKISSYSSPPNVHTIQQQTGLHCKKDSSFPNNSVTTSHIELGKSKSIVLEGPGTTTLEVWISISNETFIGSSRLVLAVHGKIKKPESDRKGKAGLILGLLGT